MSDRQRAAWQREAVAEAMTWREDDGDHAMIHVYGPKLYGPPAPGEHHCDAGHPFDGTQAGPVVFHARTEALGWSGSRFCLDCGCNPASDPEEATC